MPAKQKRKNVFYRLFFNRKDERCFGRFAFFFALAMILFTLFRKRLALSERESLV